MRRIFLTATLAGALACGTAWAQTGQTAPARKSATAHTAGQNGNNLGMVHLTHKVMANGQPLAPGTYQVRLTDEEPKAATGASPNAERWVEFVRGGKVAGKEVASVIGADDIGKIAKGPRPKANGSRVDLLKGGDYVRVWINKGGQNYLINMPPQGKG